MLRVISVPPKISDEIRKGRIERFYNVCAQVYGVRDYAGCTFDNEKQNIVFYIQQTKK